MRRTSPARVYRVDTETDAKHAPVGARTGRSERGDRPARPSHPGMALRGTGPIASLRMRRCRCHPTRCKPARGAAARRPVRRLPGRHLISTAAGAASGYGHRPSCHCELSESATCAPEGRGILPQAAKHPIGRRRERPSSAHPHRPRCLPGRHPGVHDDALCPNAGRNGKRARSAAGGSARWLHRRARGVSRSTASNANDVHHLPAARTPSRHLVHTRRRNSDPHFCGALDLEDPQRHAGP